jgi:hypothetical protein
VWSGSSLVAEITVQEHPQPSQEDPQTSQDEQTTADSTDAQVTLKSNNTESGQGLVEVKNSGNTWHLTLQGYTEAGAAGSYLWPGGVPAGVQITPRS